MSGGSVPAGQSSWISTIATANTAEETTFADRYNYVAVTNGGAAGEVLYVTADGSTPQATGAGNEVMVGAGETRVIANGLPLWYQSSTLIPEGVNQFGGDTTTSSPANPGIVQPQTSLAAKGSAIGTNPGTKITVMSATASLPYSLEGMG